jgi:hypothetical protein
MEQDNQQPRLFKTGSTIIAEDSTTAGKSPEEIREILKYQFPEVANATINLRTNDDGQKIIDYLPKPGRKG